MKKIAILVTTMLRDNLLEQAVKSMVKNRHGNVVILIGDQGLKNIDIKKKDYYENLGCYFYTLPFNCGLSYARNYLVKMAREMGCEYCVMASDSFIFNEESVDLYKVTRYLETDGVFDLIGLKLNNMDIYWVGWLEMIEGKNFVLDFIDRKKDPDIGPIYECDIVHNFFIARTASLMIVQWDENLKLAEHEDFFYRYKKSGYKVGWTREIKADRIKTRDGEHGRFRQENWVQGISKLKQKWYLKAWIEYLHRENGFYESNKYKLDNG